MNEYISVIVAAVAFFVIGMFWYSPALFANPWMKAVGFSKKDLDKAKKKGMAGSMIGGFVSYLVMAWVLNWFLNLGNVADAVSGLVYGFWMWLGFIATTSLGSVLWEKKSWQYYFINNGYNLVGLLVAGAILGVM